MLPGSSRSLSIGDLARRTGVPPATLRSWESRYGFPRAMREPSGHRRYAEAEVAAVLDVLRHRDAGFALEVAVRRATTQTSTPRSVFAELRRRHRELAAHDLGKRSLLALSHAIEDECCARAEHPLLFGAFQRAEFLRRSLPRWVELARTAQAAVVFTDETASGSVADGAPIEIALPRSAPLNREWVVICDAPDLPACLAAVELPGQAGAPELQRRFEAIWTVDPQVVRTATRVAVALADEYRPDWRPAELTGLDDEPPGASADLRSASDLLTRMVGYLDVGR